MHSCFTHTHADKCMLSLWINFSNCENTHSSFHNINCSIVQIFAYNFVNIVIVAVAEARLLLLMSFISHTTLLHISLNQTRALHFIFFPSILWLAHHPTIHFCSCILCVHVRAGVCLNEFMRLMKRSMISLNGISEHTKHSNDSKLPSYIFIP